MQEREMMKDDARLISERCIRITANFHGEIRGADTLGFLGVNDIRLNPLKERIIGAVDPEIGVTRLRYKLDINMLAAVGIGTTVSSLTDMVFNGSIPDMTHLRALMIIRGCIFVALAQHIPEPQSTLTLDELGFTTAASVRAFRDAITDNERFGIRSFKRLVDRSDLAGIDRNSTVGSIIRILREKTRPAFI